MNETTDIQARLARLSHLGHAALSLSCTGYEAAEMLRCAECLEAPPRSACRSALSHGQRTLGYRYLRYLDDAETFQAQARQHGLFTGEAKRLDFFGRRIANTLRGSTLLDLTWEVLAEYVEQGQLDRTSYLGKKGLATIRHTLRELARAAELDAIPLSPAGTRLLASLNPPPPAPKPPKYRTCEACGARHRIAA